MAIRLWWLMIFKNSGFYQLCFHNGSDNLYKGLSGEDDGSFWNGIDIAGEMEILQVIQKILVKDAKASQDKRCLLG